MLGPKLVIVIRVYEDDDGCVRLTPRGERIAGMSAYFRGHFLPTHRLLMGEYTDDLTDPFRHSIKQVDYQCR